MVIKRQAVATSVGLLVWAASAFSRAQPLFDHTASIFTEAQADRGKTPYMETCAACHGPGLNDGQFGPALTGAAFRSHWHDQTPEALLAMITSRMPPAASGSLSSQTYADIEAYLLQQNGEKAGGNEFSGGASSPDHPVAAQVAPNREITSAASTNQDAMYRAVIAEREQLLSGLRPVSDEMLQNPPPADWLMWRGGYATLGYSSLAEVNRDTVHGLTLAWSLALPPSQNESAPLVHDGVLFVMSGDTVEAVNAATGSILWRYLRALPEALHNGREARMRGMALYQGTVYAPTADGHIVALDAKSGTVRWDHAVVTPEHGVQPGLFDGAWFHISGGPLIAHGKVLVGVSLGINTGGGDYIVGLDAASGDEAWHFDTIARPGQPGGDSWNGAKFEERYGSGVWTIGSFDPALNLAYFGTGNTYDVGTLLVPHAGKKLSNNDALYTNSTLALDPDTGQLRWYYQHMNRDVWDLDWVFEQSLVTLPNQGRESAMLVTGGKMAIFDAIDRSTGRYAFSKDLGLQTLIGSIDPKTGRKNVRRELEPQSERVDLICPSASGARSWPSTAINPESGIMYVPLLDNNCMNYTWTPRDSQKIAAGGMDIKLGVRPKPGNDGKFGRIDAVDLKTRQTLWSMRQRAPVASSMLVSAGGLLFGGSRDRMFRAYDVNSGTVLWQAGLNASPSSSPAMYSVDGEQYVVIIAGGGGALDAGTRYLTPEIVDPPAGTTVWAFKLPKVH